MKDSINKTTCLHLNENCLHQQLFYCLYGKIRSDGRWHWKYIWIQVNRSKCKTRHEFIYFQIVNWSENTCIDVFWNYPFQAHEFIFSTFLYYVEFYNTITEVQITLPLPLPPIWLSMCVMLILRSIMVAGPNPCAKIRVLQY